MTQTSCFISVLNNDNICYILDAIGMLLFTREQRLRKPKTAAFLQWGGGGWDGVEWRKGWGRRAVDKEK